MKIQLLSDLHLDCTPDKGAEFLFSLDPTDVEVLSIAGDLSEIRNEAYEKILRSLCNKYPHVVYTPGNHEWWNALQADNLKKLDLMAAKFPNLHILMNRAVEIDGQRFVGTTLWFEPTAEARVRAKKWVDFRAIPDPTWIWQNITDSYNFLVKEVKNGDFVLTHHVPLGRGMDERFVGNYNNCFYLHNMYEVFNSRTAAIWHFGHTHSAKDMMAGGTRLICNPRGYAGEDTGFNRRLIVEL